MNTIRCKARAPAETQPREPTQEHDARREHAQEHRRPIGAAQIAAPSTRRWRRVGRFSPK